MTERKKIRLRTMIKSNQNSYSANEKWEYVNYLDTGNITDNKIDNIQLIDLKEEKLPSRAKRKVRHNSIIFSTVRPNQRHFGIVKNQPENFLVSTGFSVIDVVDPKLDADYLYYLLSSEPIIEGLNSIAEQSTSAYPSIKPSDIENLELVIPEIKDQKKVASILKSLDDKIALNTKINKNLLQQLRFIFSHWFTDNPQIESIRQIPLNEVCTIVTKGTTPTTLGKKFVPKGINFIKAESILDNHSIDKNKFAFIDTETNDLLKRSILKDGDIVFTIAGTLGRFALIDSSVLPANTNQAVAIIRANRNLVEPEYLYSFFVGNWHNDYYTKRIQQAVQANLSLGTIKSLPIPILSKAAMNNYLETIGPIIRMTKDNEIETTQLKNIRDTLLPKLMSGELDVSNLDL